MRVLLLDKRYQPIKIISWKKAMSLLVTGRAEAVVEYEDVWIRSTTKSFKLPSILKMLVGLAKKMTRKIPFSRANVFERDSYNCQYCGVKEISENLTFDHIIPRSRGTPDSVTSWINIATCCIPCNRKKANRTPEEAGMKLLKKPEVPRWTPQFALRLTADDPKEWFSWAYWNIPINA